MPAKDRYVEFCIEQFAPLGRVDAKYMFGGWCLYCDGTVFALVANGEVYLKGDALNIPAFEARGLKPFKPFADKPDTMKYFQAPPEIFEDPSSLKQWVGGAVEAGRRKKKAKK